MPLVQNRRTLARNQRMNSLIEARRLSAALNQGPPPIPNVENLVSGGTLQERVESRRRARAINYREHVSDRDARVSGGPGFQGLSVNYGPGALESSNLDFWERSGVPRPGNG